MSKKYWKDTYEYKRILEILDDYWLTERDEFKVRVTLDFIKGNGETQSKTICWWNPNLRDPDEKDPEETVKLITITASDLLKMTSYELFLKEEKWWDDAEKLREQHKSKTD